ncbi:MAG: hypothetical protein HY923_07655 [Elusimicrobia bacterium]|nr:hypothetical protein [Elusimicrobiota bacterium]
MSASRISLTLILLAAACGRKEPAAPEAASAGKLAALIAQSRSVGPCSAKVAGEWPAGWAVPAGGGPNRFRIFFYPLKGTPPAEPRLAGPAAEAVLDTAAGATTECRVGPPPRDVTGARWTAAADKLDADAFDAKAAELHELTEAVGAAFAARHPATPEETEIAMRYLAAFEVLAEPPYLADYYRLNPAFWEWMRKTAGRSIPKPS